MRSVTTGLPARAASTLRRLLALVGALAVACGVLAATAPSASAAPNTATVVIDTGGNVRTVTISFSQSSISGVQALQLAGADPVTRPYGPGLAVCMLDGVGWRAPDCLGTPSDPRYWAYFRAPAGATSWSYSGMGAGSSQVRDGDWEGWRFGTGQQPRATPPAPKPSASPPAPSPGGAGADRDGGSTAASGSTSGRGATPSEGGEGPGPAASSADGGRDVEARGGEAGDGDDDTDDTSRDAGASDVSSSDDPDDVQAAAAVGERAGSTDGGGSPLGAILALALAAVLVTAAVVMHRRRSSVPS